MARALRPTSFEAAAGALAGAAGGGETVRIVGAGTKREWGAAVAESDVELHTSALDRIAEHNAGDLTAVLEAGVRLEAAQLVFASEGQMLALDPPLGSGGQATIGGVIATADSGPLAHRYGSPRDLVLGMTVALSDGAIARSGGKVIKNVAGYDVAKLFCGAFGTLGMILAVNVRLHPLAAATATAAGVSASPEVLAAAGRELAGRPFELDALDVAWRGGRGGVLARCAGAAAELRARQVADAMKAAGLEHVEVVIDDAELWERQRAGQRSSGLALVRVHARPSRLEQVIEATARAGGTLVGRVALGTTYVELDPEAVAGLRAGLPAGSRSVLLDAPAQLRGGMDPWGPAGDPVALELMRRVKARFDPAGTCNRGLFVGAI